MPVKPEAHVQLYLLTWSLQVAVFLHGLEVHIQIFEVNNIKLENIRSLCFILRKFRETVKDRFVFCSYIFIIKDVLNFNIFDFVILCTWLRVRFCYYYYYYVSSLETTFPLIIVQNNQFKRITLPHIQNYFFNVMIMWILCFIYIGQICFMWPYKILDWYNTFPVYTLFPLKINLLKHFERNKLISIILIFKRYVVT